MMLLAALLALHLRQPPELPQNFDPSPFLLPTSTDTGDIDSPRGAAALAEGLVAEGSPQSIALAEQLLGAVLDAQETRPGAAHRGNFLWHFDAEVMNDLNSVEFTLRHLIPMMIDHGERLSDALRGRVLDAIRLGLEEIARMNVDITYTNVATMDCANTILGGELLDDPLFAQRGYARLVELERATLSHGTFCEYNTPTYTRVTHDALTRIARYARNEEAAIRARALRARLALTAALHVHPEYGFWAGPHGRGHSLAKPESIPPEMDYLREWIERSEAPASFEAMLDRPLPYQVWESVRTDRNIGIMTLVNDVYAMGTATREISRQSHIFLVQAARNAGGSPAVAYSKYFIDDSEDVPEHKSLWRKLLWEQGKFYGVQWDNRMIGLYAPRTLEHPGSVAPASLNRFQSAKAVVEFANRDPGDGVWVGETPVSEFPRDLGEGEVVVVQCGAAYVAVRPLSRDDLGYQSPLRLVQRADRLALEMYNYLGPEISIWDMDRESRFFQGKPRCGFYAEVFSPFDDSSGADFAREVARGIVRDEAEPPVTSYHDDTERMWSVEYGRDGHRLGIEIDLTNWELKRRWNQDGDLAWPLLDASTASQTDTGKVTVGDASVTCGLAPAWLYAVPSKRVYLAGYHGTPAPFTLKTPEGTIHVDAMGTGTVSWCDGEVVVDAIHSGEPRVERAGQ